MYIDLSTVARLTPAPTVAGPNVRQLDLTKKVKQKNSKTLTNILIKWILGKQRHPGDLKQPR